MITTDFQKAFEAEFAAPLIEQGFQKLGRGYSLHLIDGTRQLLIKRQGGRLARPNVARTVVCFRHTFLRPIKTEDPHSTVIRVEDCPRKLTFDDFAGWRRPKIRYRPENTGRWHIHDVSYADSDAVTMSRYLNNLAGLVIKRIVPWTRTLTEEGELMQLKRYGENAWCEQRWIEDYEGFLSRAA